MSLINAAKAVLLAMILTYAKQRNHWDAVKALKNAGAK